MTIGQLGIIGSRGPICNVGQCEGLYANIYKSLWANLSLSKVGSPFTTLANAEACAQKLINYWGPTQAYRKQAAHSQLWPIQRLVWEYLCVHVGQLDPMENGPPIHNIGQ